MTTLSVFIDESGDFGEKPNLPAYYLVTLVFHNQEEDIKENVARLERNVRDSGYPIEYIHTGPLIRKEGIFSNYSIDDRRKLLFKMLNFVLKTPIMCETIVVDRRETTDRISLSGRLSRDISRMLAEYDDYFRSFDNIIVYYDNGQRDLSVILNAVFSAHYSSVEFRRAEPQKYRLLQAADFICSLELLRTKKRNNMLSRSEKQFFYKPQELKKTFFKAVDKKSVHNIPMK